MLLIFTKNYKMKVLKFGGTSIGSSDYIQKVVNIINDGNSKFIVFSAFSKITNLLSEFISQLKLRNFIVCEQILYVIKDRHISIISDLILTDKFRQIAFKKVNDSIETLLNFLNKKYLNDEDENMIISQGELLSVLIIYIYALEKEIDVAYIPAFHFMQTDENNEPNIQYIEENLNREISRYPECKLFITSGFICKNKNGKISNLGRGASDYTATLIANILNASEVEIWTDIDGIHNNDPRFVEETHSIKHLSYNEACELAYFGAKVLHPSSITPAQVKDIPIIIKNTMSPASLGTHISNYTIEKGIKAIASKDNITTIKVKSGRMMQAYGFLRRIFEVFEKYKTSVDMLTTSEISVAMTIDNKTFLPNILNELKNIGEVELRENQSIICVVGHYSKSNIAIKNIINSFDSISIEMISFGSSNNNISFVINSDQKVEALNILNQNIFTHNTCLTSN